MRVPGLFGSLGIIYIGLWIYISITRIGTIQCTEPYTVDYWLVITLISMVIVPFICGYLEGLRNSKLEVKK